MNWAVKSESAKQSGLNSGDFEELFIDLAVSNAESETSSGDSSVQLRDFSAVKADLGAPDIHITPGAPEVYLIPGADHHQHVAADPLQSAASEVEWEGKAGKGCKTRPRVCTVQNYHPTSHRHCQGKTLVRNSSD